MDFGGLGMWEVLLLTAIGLLLLAARRDRGGRS